MDCDKFDRVLMDLLYEELDELTRAAAVRHSDQCQRCHSLYAGFKATRDTGLLRLEQPPDGFEQRVLEAERQVRRVMPWGQRVRRSITILAGYAMRPQLAMAALLLLMIGSSLVLLRPKPGSHSSVQVTERGIPEAEKDSIIVAIPPTSVPSASAEPAPVAAPKTDLRETARPAQPASKPELPTAVEEQDGEEYDRARAEAEDRAYADAMSAFRAERHTDAQHRFDAIVNAGSRNAAAAELYAALATEKASGCATALPRFDSVSARSAHSHLGHQAIWHSATCRLQLGNRARAQLDFVKLLSAPAYRARAERALAAFEGKPTSPVVAQQQVGAARPHSSARPQAAASTAAAYSKGDGKPISTANKSIAKVAAPSGQTTRKAAARPPKAKAKTKQPQTKPKSSAPKAKPKRRKQAPKPDSKP